MEQVHKQYEKAFLLEPTKLGRIVDTIHERLGDRPGAVTHDTFEVFLTGNRREELSSMDALLALDNSRRSRITRLLILCTASTPGAARAEHEVLVDFGAPKSDSTGRTTTVVSINVRSDATGWCSRTLSEVEEQVERTWLPRGRPLAILLLLFFVGLIVLASQFLYVRVGARPDSMWLNESDFKRLESLVASGRVLTDAELREVVTMQVRNVLEGQRPPPTQPNQLRLTMFIAVPLLVVLACIVVLLVTCYPSKVFLWGDEVERYSNTLQRRRTLWSIILGVVVVGVLSKFLFEGFAMWLPRKS